MIVFVNMKNIQLCNIPNFLVNSVLYEQLAENEEISISESRFIEKIEINDINDFAKTLDVLRYWMVNDVPDEIFNFIENNSNLNFSEIFKRFADFPFILELKLLLDFARNENLEDIRRAKNMMLAIYGHHPKSLQLMVDSLGGKNSMVGGIIHTMQNTEMDIVENKYRFVNLIAKNDYLNLLKYIYNQQKYDFSNDFMGILVIENSPECLKFMQENNSEFPASLGIVAAAFGHYEILKFLHTSGCSINDVTGLAACMGSDVKCYKYVNEQANIKVNYEKTQTLIGKFMLQYNKLKDNVKSSMFSAIQSFASAFSNNLNSIPNLLPGFTMPVITNNFYGQTSTQITEQTETIIKEIGKHLNFKSLYPSYASLTGNLELLKEMHKDGHRIDNGPLVTSVKFEYLDCIKFSYQCMKDDLPKNETFKWMTGLTTICGMNGNLEILKFLHDNGCPLEPLCLQNAAFKGHFNIVKYCCENNCELSKQVIDNAVCNGHYEILSYLLDKGCPVSGEVYATIVDFAEPTYRYAYDYPKPDGEMKFSLTEEEKKEKRLKMLKLIHEKELSTGNISWNCFSASHACKNGDIEVFKYLHENGCDIDSQSCLSHAITSGNLELVKYTHKLYKADAESGKLNSAQQMYANHNPNMITAFALLGDDKTYFCNNACRGGFLNILKYLHENEFEWGAQAYTNTLTSSCYINKKSIYKSSPAIEIIKYLHENGCPMKSNEKNTDSFWANSSSIGTAAVNGELESLKYLFENGGELPTDTYFSSSLVASCVGSYASCTFDMNNVTTDVKSIKTDNFECLKYLCENGLKLRRMSLAKAKQTHNQELIDYVQTVYIDEPGPKKRNIFDMMSGTNANDSLDGLSDLSDELSDELSVALPATITNINDLSDDLDLDNTPNVPDNSFNSLPSDL
jgi:hypothetical protein